MNVNGLPARRLRGVAAIDHATKPIDGCGPVSLGRYAYRYAASDEPKEGAVRATRRAREHEVDSHVEARVEARIRRVAARLSTQAAANEPVIRVHVIADQPQGAADVAPALG